jgi:hypothetical protein
MIICLLERRYYRSENKVSKTKNCSFFLQSKFTSVNISGRGDPDMTNKQIMRTWMPDLETTGYNEADALKIATRAQLMREQGDARSAEDVLADACQDLMIEERQDSCGNL